MLLELLRTSFAFLNMIIVRMTITVVTGKPTTIRHNAHITNSNTNSSNSTITPSNKTQ